MIVHILLCVFYFNAIRLCRKEGPHHFSFVISNQLVYKPIFIRIFLISATENEKRRINSETINFIRKVMLLHYVCDMCVCARESISYRINFKLATIEREKRRRLQRCVVRYTAQHRASTRRRKNIIIIIPFGNEIVYVIGERSARKDATRTQEHLNIKCYNIKM